MKTIHLIWRRSSWLCVVVCLYAFSSYSAFADTRIAILNFELKDTTLLPQTPEELERTASMKPLLEKFLKSTDGYELVRINSDAQLEANAGFGYLFNHPDATADLGNKFGLAGGPKDKSWLLLRAAYLQRYGSDIEENVETIAVAPPLASAQLERGNLDAIVQFWHFIARLMAKGESRRLVMVDTFMKELGLTETVPLLVYVFKDDFVRQHPQVVQSFINAVYEAKHQLKTHDEVWKDIEDLVKAPDAHTLDLIRQAWRQGVPTRWEAETFTNLERLFDIMRKIGGKQLVGADTIPEGTFLKDITF